MSLEGANDTEKLHNLLKLSHKDQAVWFLNAFWHKFGEQDAENFWDWVHKMNDLDLQNGAQGSSVDEMKAHQFLEHFKETMTVREMRNKLREVGAIAEKERVKNFPITHFLVMKYIERSDWHKLVHASQGDNQEEIEQAQQKLADVQEAFRQSEARAKEAAAALLAAQQAKAELQKALDELKAQEEAYNQKTETLKQKSETGGIVSRNKAKNELAQHLGEDPLPLRRAKITTEAATKKAERTQKAAEEAKAAAEAALENAKKELAEAEAFLEEVKSKGGSAEGTLWWIERELHEQKKYLPMSKGGIAK